MNRTDVWHEMISRRNVAALDDLLATEAVFYSPVMHSPQQGKRLVQQYLSAAFSVLLNDSFTYVRSVVEGDNTILEFELELDGICINGVDMIKWDENGQIIDFKVMLRPAKAMQKVQIEMAKMLEKMADRRRA